MGGSSCLHKGSGSSVLLWFCCLAIPKIDSPSVMAVPSEPMKSWQCHSLDFLSFGLYTWALDFDSPSRVNTVT